MLIIERVVSVSPILELGFFFVDYVFTLMRSVTILGLRLTWVYVGCLVSTVRFGWCSLAYIINTLVCSCLVTSHYKISIVLVNALPDRCYVSGRSISGVKIGSSWSVRVSC